MIYSFAECAVLDKDTGAISVYSPLLINNGQNSVKPAVPTLPANPSVACWFGTNGDSTILQQTPGYFNGACVNGDPNVPGDIFGQFAACGATQFWQDVKIASTAGKITVPANSLDIFGLPCPTTRSYEIVDADPSDNMVTIYLWDQATNTVMQASAANKALFPNAVELTNGSDNRLLDFAYGPAIGCPTFKAANLASQDTDTVYGKVGALALNELRAAVYGSQNPSVPQALVTVNNPMTAAQTKNDSAAISKTNAYRIAVNQELLAADTDIELEGYDFCWNFLHVTGRNLLLKRLALQRGPSPNPEQGTNLFSFLVARFSNSWTALKCDHFLATQSLAVLYDNTTTQLPMIPVVDQNNVCTYFTPNCRTLRKTIHLDPLAGTFPAL